MNVKKKIAVFAIVILCLASISAAQDTNVDFPKLTGQYLGQKPPGKTPEIFAPNILNTRKMAAFGTLFSQDLSEFYTVRFERAMDKSGGIVVMNKINNRWTEPELLSFDCETWDNDMTMSADGNLFIFRTFRDIPGIDKPANKAYIWRVSRQNGKWGTESPLYCGNELLSTHYPSLTSNNTLYFKHRQDDRFGIFKSVPVNGVYGKPEHVYTAVDTLFTESDVFVAPDESYMIITCYNHPQNFGKRRDLYLVFKNEKGEWSEEIHMGSDINTDLKENCPYVSPDGKYLFFYRYNSETKFGDIYWVDAKIIDDLKAKHMK